MIGLEREPDPMMDAGSPERTDDRPGVLGQTLEVVDEEGRAACARERLGVAAGDGEPAVDHVEARADPPIGRIDRQ